MERHDTHILSDSQEDDEKEENDHFYSFNNSKNSDSNSLKNTIHSNSKRGSKFNLNDLIQTKNNDENEIYNESLVSSKDLEELFYDEKRFTKQIIKKNEKDKESEKDKEKEKKVENNNVENNNKSMDKIELKNSLMESNVDTNKNKLNETEINKIPDNIKIKMIKLNYDDNISVFNNLLTYTPNLINKLKLKKTKKKRNCISFEKDKEKVKNKLKNNQNKKEEIKKNIRIQKKKKINLPQSDDTPSEKSSFNNNINNNNIENKKMKNLFDILKNNNLKSFKISTNSFTIMTKNTNSSNDKSKTAKKKLRANNSIGFELNNKIQKQNEFYLKHDYEYNLLKRYNFSPGKIQINGKKRFQILQSKQENNKLHQEYDSKFIITNNNSQYSLRYYNNNNSSNNNNTNNKYIQNRHSNEFHSNYIPEYDNEYDEDYDYNENEYNNNYNEDEYYSIINRMKRMNMYNTNKNLKKNSGLKLKTDKKIKILYDLYCKRPKKEAKSINRINSAYSLKNGRTRFTNLPNVNYMDLNNNLENRDYMIKNRLYNNNNNKNWLLKLIKVQKDKNMYHYEKHFGNNESCPLCQQMDKKNEEQIRKIGVYHMASDIKKSDSRSNSKKKRRINSAFPNSHIKNFNAQFSNEINKSGTRNNLHYNKSTAFFNEYNLSKNMINGNKMKRKLQFNNRQKYMNSNFS